VHATLLAQSSETNRASNLSAPATQMAQYLMKRRLPACFLLAQCSLHKDLESGCRTPTPDTLNFLLRGIQLLKEQLKRPDGVSDDIVLAVACLWKYEASLTMGIVEESAPTLTETQTLAKSFTSNIRTHIDGLQRSIKCVGGLSNLSSETLWLLAW
jgi:hypothetical protein